MTEAKIEDRLASAIAAALPTAHIIRTFAVSAAGTVRNLEDEAALTINIATASRQQTDWEIPRFDISFAIELSVRLDEDVTGATYLAAADALTTLLTSWTGRGAAGILKTDLGVTGEFVPSYARLDGGDNTFDRDAAVAVFTQTLTLRGVIN